MISTLRRNRPQSRQMASDMPNKPLNSCNMFTICAQIGRGRVLLHKFVTVFDTEAESVACSASARLSLARATGAAPAAPAGGAQSDWGRGCGNLVGKSIQRWVALRGAQLSAICRLATIAACLTLPLSASFAASGTGGDTTEQTPALIPVPSAQPVTLSEVLLDDAPGALWARFRFVAPEIAKDGDPDARAADIDYLCTEVAVPYLRLYEIAPERVVVSLSDRVLPFGSSEPEATQFFETYRVEDNACVWEGF